MTHRPPPSRNKTPTSHHRFSLSWLECQAIAGQKQINQIANYAPPESPGIPDSSENPSSEYIQPPLHRFLLGQNHSLEPQPSGWLR